MAQEATFEELSQGDEVTAEDLDAPAKRASNPIKQGIAGVTDAGTGVPILAGLVGAGLESIADYALDDNDKSFGDTFATALKSGKDAELMQFGGRGREHVNEFFGIKEPVSTEDQAARLFGSLAIPVPGGFLGGVGATGIKGALGKASVFASPAVRVAMKPKYPKAAASPAARLYAKHGKKIPLELDKKTTGIRLGTQLGVGTGIDQAVRHNLTGQPLLFSDEALSGIAQGKGVPEGTFGGEEGLPPGSTTELMGGSGGDVTLDMLDTPAPTGDDLDQPDAVATMQREMDKASQDAQDSRDLTITTMLGLAAASAFGVHRWRQARAASQAPASPTGTAPAAPKNVLKNTIGEINAEKGIVDKVKKAGELIGDRANKLGAEGFDATEHIARELRSAGVPDKYIQQLRGQDVFDTPGQLQEFLESGTFSDGTKVSVPMRDLKREFDRWDANKQQEFIDYAAGLREEVVRTRATAEDFLDKAVPELDETGRFVDPYSGEGSEINRAIINITEAHKGENIGGSFTHLDNLLMKEHAEIVANVRGTRDKVKVGLYKSHFNSRGVETGKTFVTNAQIKDNIAKGSLPQNSDFKRMITKIAEQNDAVLMQGVKRGVYDNAWAHSIRTQFTRDGKLLYLPGKSAISKEVWYKRLAANMGYFTSEGKNLHRVGNFYKQSLGHGEGIASPLDPFNASAHYLGEVLEHVNRNAAQWNVLKKLTGIKLEPVEGSPIPKITMPDTPLYKGAPNFVGRVSAHGGENRFGMINMVPHDPKNPLSAKLVSEFKKPTSKGTNQSFPEQLASLDKDGALVVQHEGSFYVFNGFEPGLFRALEFDARLYNGFLKFGNHWKKIFTRLTTGDLSLFAPISAVYNFQVGVRNAALRAEGGFLNAGKAAIDTWKAGMKGSWELFSTKVADDYAQILTEALERNSGFAGMSPQWTKSMRDRLASKAKQSMLGPIQRNTGKFADLSNADPFQGNITDVLSKSAFHIGERYGSNALPQFARIWNHLNSALHNGVAYGLTAQKLGGKIKGKTPNQIREARRFAADIVGDNRLRGSSNFAIGFNAVVPFSGAMLQAWSTMGRAMFSQGFTKGAARTIAVMTTSVGLPTAMEVMYNNALDPEAKFEDANGVKWGYRDWYWKGFSADQRNNNMIIMIPGQPPWDAIIIPIVPEVSLFRSAVIDGMETVFGMSEKGMEEGNHFIAAGTRTFNIPVPPPVKAFLSGLGIDVRAGPAVDDTTGEGLTFFNTRNLPIGERVTPNMGRTRYVGGEVETRFQAILQDLFGAAGTLGVSVYEAFNSGNKDTPTGDKVTAGFSELGRGLSRQAKYLQPFLGKALRTHPDPDMARSVVRKKDALESFMKNAKIAQKPGYSGSIPQLGDTVEVSNDPIMQELSILAPKWKKKIQGNVKAVGNLRNMINTMGTALNLPKDFENIKAGPITVKQRDRIIDSLNSQIDAHNHVIDAVLSEAEIDFADYMGKQLGRDMTGFTFANFSARVNAPNSALKAPPK